jgi:hypothetical protein
VNGEHDTGTTAAGNTPDGDARFGVPSRRVAADVVDDEVVIVDLETGSYYTTEGAGCDAWRLLAAGVSVAETTAALRSRYVDDGEIEEYVAALVAAFTGKGLLVPATGPSDETVDLGPVRGLLAPVSDPAPFAAVDVVAFDDMQSLLLLDPVHEVDDRGWPHAAPGV